LTLTHLVPTPESLSARVAVQELASEVGSPRRPLSANPLYLHGPSGVGKTLLITSLIEEVLRTSPRLTVAVLQAGEFEALVRAQEDPSAHESEELQAAQQSDLLIVEDLQHLCHRNDERRDAIAETFVQIFDDRQARRKHMVFTATVGPGQLLRLSSRLVSRLCSGLVIGLLPLQESSRLQVLADKAQQRQLAVGRDVLSWLAKHLVGGGRQLEGAITQLDMLARLRGEPLDVLSIAAHFREQGDAARPTIERIAEHVGSYFRVDPKHLLSQRRHQKVVLPRQVGMYLTRKLTTLSLERIGEYFGGRDHSTVFHACRKIEEALPKDAGLATAVQQLQAALA
jgi:chromosomal replication initiator protein